MFELEDGTRIDTSGFNDFQMTFFKENFPGAKEIVNIEAENFPKEHRPWGWYESLTSGPQFQVKRICVLVGGKLSLQSHRHRSEHWVVVEGTAKVTINNETNILKAGESTYVPLGCKHRLENKGKIPLLIIEIQIGSYLGEDDITRYDDIYSR